jgi:hypothetical protein
MVDARKLLLRGGGLDSALARLASWSLRPNARAGAITLRHGMRAETSCGVTLDSWTEITGEGQVARFYEWDIQTGNI